MSHATEVHKGKGYTGAPPNKGTVVQILFGHSQLVNSEVCGLMGDLRCFEVTIGTRHVFTFRGDWQRKGEMPPRLSEFAQLGLLPLGNSYPGCSIALLCVIWDEQDSPDVTLVLREVEAAPRLPSVDPAIRTLELVESIVQGRK